MSFGTDETVPVGSLPELAFGVKSLVDFVGGEAFEGAKYVLKRPAFFLDLKNMDVVRHHDEAVELIALAIKMMKGVSDNSMMFPEATGAVVLIEFVFEREDEATVVFGGGF